MEVNELEYNTQMPKMALPEYGRNVQRMVDHALTIEDREERTRCAYAIVQTMGNLFPHLRDVSDFRHKLWDHLAIMSDFRLDIDYPCEIVPRENLATRPEKVPYQSHDMKIRHYGQMVEELIAKAVEMEAGEERDSLCILIANHMKKSFVQMNREPVDDRKIFDDLYRLSDGKITLSEDTVTLVDVRDLQLPGKKNQKNNRRR